MSVETWKELAELSVRQCAKKKLGKDHISRLKFEIKEINKQGANNYWVRLYNSDQKFDANKNGLVLPFLLDITDVDPIEQKIPHIVEYHPDFPDIDIDFLPLARDPVKKYAEEQYGSEFVCSVGLWQTYNAKLALQDAAAALGHNRHEVIAICKNLPDDFDQMPKSQAMEEYSEFKKLAEAKPEVVEFAYKMIGKIKAQGKHAGGIIISDVPIRDYVPLTLCGSSKNKQWTSAWTEGMAATQLSKFGFVKFDLLGLLNLSYIYNCKRILQENDGIEIDFDDVNPLDDRAGWFFKDGVKTKILLNDPKTLDAADKVLVDSIFQFDTDFQKSIVEKGGVKSFMDLVIYTSLGRPGPLPMIDVYIANRNDPKERWKRKLHPKMLDILEETKGVLTFQEQLLRIWVEVCGFTMPEAEAAQKAVKKKKIEILEEIGPKVVKGAATILGEDVAQELWDQMVSFGRYCFNKSHAVGYMIIAYRCLWLKTHYPAEWWAATLSECPQIRMIKYMGSARSEGIKFGSIDVNYLTVGFSVDKDRIVPGVSTIKGIRTSAEKLSKECLNGPFDSVDNFVKRCGRSKTNLERLIKLGGFNSIGTNRKALWMYYRYRYDSGSDVTKLRRAMNHCYSWPLKEILSERDRQITEWKRLYPKRKKIPVKILKWLPKTPHSTLKKFDVDVELKDDDLKAASKLKLNFEQVMALFPKDYKLQELLKFEKEYLGYYWNSPLDMFHHSKDTTIEHAKTKGVLECVIEEVHFREGARGGYCILNITDGINTTRVNVWGDVLDENDDEVFEVGRGVRMMVRWQDKWRSFSVKRDTLIMLLESVEE